jgi:hypothetical protein
MDFQSIDFGIVLANMIMRKRNQAHLFVSFSGYSGYIFLHKKNGDAKEKMGFRVLR